jgi:hypothetical protein
MITEMPFDQLEEVYEALAKALDKVGPEHETLVLTKLVLALVHRTGDLDAFSKALKIALRDLPPGA